MPLWVVKHSLMAFTDFLKSPPADFENLREEGNIPALISLMRHTDPDVRWQAAGTLGSIGTLSVVPLIRALSSSDPRIRLGATGVLGTLKDPRAIGPLIDLFHHEKHIEIRWASVLALGGMESRDQVPHLVLCLKDADKYIRYGAALSLDRLGWQATDKTDLLYYYIALEDWESVRACGPVTAQLLSVIFRDSDPSTRSSIISLLGETGQQEALTTCQRGLRDGDPGVRWTAVLASMNCGIKPVHLPLLVADRERSGPDPAAAALLNFLFLGIGYNYIGKWWGFPVFMTYMSVLVLAQLYAGPFLPYFVAYPITAVLGVHTYYMAERMSDRGGP
jgi:HEAT repeat protein